MTPTVIANMLDGPTNGLAREIRREVQLGKLVLPANIILLVQNIALHHDPHVWGDDAHLFKPGRFVDGIARHGCVFSLRIGTSILCLYDLCNHGNQDCSLHDFATLHLHPLPCYVHSPTPIVSLHPQHGLQIILESLHNDA
ncbi:hypothetical protein V6N12_027774 [Hibiscus sabdariffa]|uniref:Cytochrome P450 n=1 Tax=Hibiscus sabdariffa TaxID=183260 RepID=A0ABR2F3W1_9ROSI